MASLVRIPPPLRQGFNKLVELDDKSISQLSSIVGNTPVLSSRHDLEQLLVSSSILDISNAKEVSRFLLGVAQIQSTLDLSASETFEVVNNGLKDLKNASDYTEEPSDKWSRIKNQIETILDSPSIQYLAKANTLLYERDNIFNRCRIITDIRPVYNVDDTNFPLVIALSTLHIDYYDNDVRKSISIAIDEDDISSLKIACDRAIAKLSVVNNKMREFGIATTAQEGKANE